MNEEGGWLNTRMCFLSEMVDCFCSASFRGLMLLYVCFISVRVRVLIVSLYCMFHCFRLFMIYSMYDLL